MRCVVVGDCIFEGSVEVFVVESVFLSGEVFVVLIVVVVQEVFVVCFWVVEVLEMWYVDVIWVVCVLWVDVVVFGQLFVDICCVDVVYDVVIEYVVVVGEVVFG